MESKNIYSNLPPLDHQYYSSSKNLFEHLSECFSEQSNTLYSLKADAALLKCHKNNFFNVDLRHISLSTEPEKKIQLQGNVLKMQLPAARYRTVINNLKEKI